jgi:hypothetical protein
MRNRVNLLVVCFCLLMAACRQDQKPVAVIAPAIEKKPVVMDPFRFHKLVEVAPGNDFDILSWGRGSSTVGSFLVLHSDSANMKYTTTTGDLDGTIVDVYNADMDMDGNPEILIQAKAIDTISSAVIYAFEFNGGKANKLDFPKLTKSQKQGYRGNDNFYIQDGKFMREFPVYTGSGTDAKPTGQKRLLQYGLRDNEFTVQQLSKDSTATGSKKQPSSLAATKSGSSTTTSSSKKKKKHKEKQTTTHHKKKKKHHHSEE